MFDRDILSEDLQTLQSILNNKGSVLYTMGVHDMLFISSYQRITKTNVVVTKPSQYDKTFAESLNITKLFLSNARSLGNKETPAIYTLRWYLKKKINCKIGMESLYQ